MTVAHPTAEEIEETFTPVPRHTPVVDVPVTWDEDAEEGTE